MLSVNTYMMMRDAVARTITYLGMLYQKGHETDSEKEEANLCFDCLTEAMDAITREQKKEQAK